MSDWYMGKLARQDQDAADAYAQQEAMQQRAYAFPRDAIELPPQQPGALADQTNYDPWERSAAAVRFAAKPLAGRQGDPDRIANIASAPLRAAAGFTKAALDRAAEEHGGVSQLSTDYDPRATGAFLGAETAMNTVGLPALTGGVPAGAVGSAARDPNLWHDLSRVRLPRPVAEMQATHVPTQAVKEKVITPAEMEGGWLLPAVGDRSRVGSNLTGYNGFMFANPVEMQGGHGFMAAQADKGLAWASNPGVITRISNKVKKLGAEGDPVYFPYTAMHPEGADFSHHVSDTLSEAVKLVKPSREAQRQFNRTMKADDIDFGSVKNWPGVMSDNLREYLIKAPGDVRNKFAKVMDTRKFQDAGFPSVAEARHAVTDPRLLDAPRGSAGLSISKMDPAGTAIPGASGHRTYSTDIAGNYIGGLARMIPRDVFYPDIVKGYQKLGSDPNLFMALGRTGAPIAQKATPEWVDNVSKWMEQNPRAGMKYSNFTDKKTGATLAGLAAMDDYRPPFYSAVERAVQGAKQNVAPGQQWAGYLRNQPGVKPEEVEALKLGQLFEQSGAVPKQAVLDQIAANRVNVGEVVKGDVGPLHQFGTPEQQAAAIARLEAARQAMVRTRLGDVGSPQWVAAGVEHRAAEEAMRDIVPGWGRAPDTTANPTKFGTYTLPGGENYREMLLTLPDKTGALDARKAVFDKYSEQIRTLHRQLETPGIANRDQLERQRLRLESARDVEADLAGAVPEGFRSSHFDEPNILAHVRYNDRVIDGKKTLFVEEVQSDWHQAGRTKGYTIKDEAEKAALVKERDALMAEARAVPASEGMDRYRSIRDQIVQLNRRIAGEGSVPDAPFKTTWPELAMKRIIREAAEKGYDKVAWTPGSVQADRYDLSKHVNKISAVRLEKAGELQLKDGKPQYQIDAFGKDNRLAFNKHGVSEDELAEIVGKEMADKIVKQQNGVRNYTGLDLQIGGEGMKGFYDEILPATVNKLVKKHGGRVGQGNINVTPHSSDAAGSGLQIRPYGGHSYEVFDTATGALEQRFGTLEEARAHLAGIREAERPKSVHTIDITPSLREAAMKGFPLFTAGGTAVLGGLAAQDQYGR